MAIDVNSVSDNGKQGAISLRQQELTALTDRRDSLIRLSESKDFAIFLQYITESVEQKRGELVASPVIFKHEKVRTYVAGETHALEFVIDFVKNQITHLNNEISAVQGALNHLTGEDDDPEFYIE